MGKYKIIYDREGCISAYACCVVCPNHWVINSNDSKADLVDAVRNPETGMDEKDIDEEDFESNKAAAISCPVNVIHIIDKETGEKII